MSHVERKTILITGASSGLGEGMAREFAKQGRNLALCARRTERLEQLQDELTKAYPACKVSVKALDVNDHDAVFRVFKEFKAEFGELDRVIVNAGMGKGASLGTGYFYANVQTAQTNFVAALAQCEAALEIFREQNSGHLVTISSISALRGMPRAMTVYAATKAGLLALTEGIRADLIKSRSPIKTSCILPGYIRSEINEKVKNTPFMIDNATGCRLLVKAIEKEPVQSFVPTWPWAVIGFLMKRLPLKMVMKLG
ncbi:SDR family oxidoreductase [Pseudidiomarina terrestris]|uniref:SDR family oxidoreductase n=1 Tax=Pseudidiomarina terrestris TaxID=2820060 RepID=A0AAW7QV53_9GAMM|nr:MULTISPECIES: SDR family oxidoreductase [unclassified Pseudidiomarina]MDN7124072.1 SDR family oxidoreductase [Pseudidiomarina sp. 1APP75-32.1]MDN7128329.1 SDR family oxidoreductase [Pseudidiomarina sp. 1APR75-15]MDN7135443.1 SDR family oxidoreductase [Pseudidiomarina sp. 1ASP75-5]MDN7138525.1 SDR family oxidoreductase [Pseudidiomarina sp. 1ASP75-14]MEA3586819.1 SDR family oxidoreductase [Pseudidiomarina sp. 1APP75-27a]